MGNVVRRLDYNYKTSYIEIMDDQIASQTFSALGHPARVQVLRLLVKAGCAGLSVGQLRGAVDVPASTFAHHLKALADAGLVRQQKRGREIISTADYNTIQRLTAFLIQDCCKGAFGAEPSLKIELETT